MRICGGIDEAGFGPVLGPLVVAAVTVRADPDELVDRFARAPLGVRDSKRLHTPGDLRPLESVALAAVGWLCGMVPATAAECFALLGEAPAVREGLPWMTGAERLALPCAAREVPGWRLDGVEPRGLSGRILHPGDLNRAAAAGDNRAATELAVVGDLLRATPGSTTTVVDRLGGRRYYAPFLAGLWPDATVATTEESRHTCAYRVTADGIDHAISFLVDGERRWPLTAIAGCIAKYVRELHMRLFNDHWCGRFPWLAPTAGYPRDARRWLFQLGSGTVGAYGPELVRGYDDNT